MKSLEPTLLASSCPFPKETAKRATNPCNCGMHGSKLKQCKCSLQQIDKYLAKISGPLLDRIAIHIRVQPVDVEVWGSSSARMTSVERSPSLSTSRTDRELWVWPGMHTGNMDGKNASTGSDPNERVPTGFAVDGYDGLPLGLRLRLKSSFDIAAHLASVGITPSTSPGNVTPAGAIWTNYQAMTRILECYKTYGLICADRGGHMYVQGTRDTRWDNAVLNPVYHGKSATGYNGLNSSSFRVIKRGWSPPGQKPGDKEPQG